LSRGEMNRVVLLFDDNPESIILDLMLQGAKEAEWQALPFDDPNRAARELERTLEVGAIVTTLGWQNGSMITSGRFSSYPAHPIISRSNQHSAPRAVVSESKRSVACIRGGTRDTVILLGKVVDLGSKVSTWLNGLVEPPEGIS